MRSVDLNCDLGERSHLYEYDIDKDLSLMKYASSVNLACGFHAGDAHTMHLLVEAALEQEIAIGAHPAFPDKENFGRTNMLLSPEIIYDIMLYQLGALQAFVRVYHSNLRHVKPHGALYNMAAKEPLIASAVANAVRDFDDRLILFGLSGSEMIRIAQESGLKTASEVFADRTYQEDGTLTPRTERNAIIDHENDVIDQVVQMVTQGSVNSISGKSIPIIAETICIHGDGQHALAFAQVIQETLKKLNIDIHQPG